MRPFLNGTVRLATGKWFPSPTTDSLLLAMSVEVSDGQRVLDLGCGPGTLLLLHGARLRAAGKLPTCLHGIEKDAQFLDIAQSMATENALDLWLLAADVAAFVKPETGEAKATEALLAIEENSYDIVVANPPFYFDGTRGNRRGAWNHGAEKDELAQWLILAQRKLAHRGFGHLIVPTSLLPLVLSTWQTARQFRDAGDFRIIPIRPHAGSTAIRTLIRWQKGVSAPLQILPSLVLRPEKDGRESAPSSGDSPYTQFIESVLRDGLSIRWESNDNADDGQFAQATRG